VQAKSAVVRGLGIRGELYKSGQTVDGLAASEKLRSVNQDSCGRVTNHASIIVHSSSEHSLAVDWWSEDK
jgi:hypothetical protein